MLLYALGQIAAVYDGRPTSVGAGTPIMDGSPPGSNFRAVIKCEVKCES